MTKIALVLLTSCLMFPTISIGKSKKSKWCCMVDDKIAKTPGKKGRDMCIKSKAAPTTESRSKLAKKYAKSCADSEGSWESKPKG